MKTLRHARIGFLIIFVFLSSIHLTDAKYEHTDQLKKAMQWITNTIFVPIKTDKKTSQKLLTPGSSKTYPIIDSQLPLTEALRGLPPNTPSEIVKNQQLVDVYYYSFDNKIHKGQLLIDKRLVADIKEAFEVMFKEKFPVKSVIPISVFRWDDESSMQANNTSAFNYRYVAGTTTLSMHAQGWALDINPKHNPFIKGINSEIVQPEKATYNPYLPGTLTAKSKVVKKLKELGWEWGGDWTTNTQGIPVKDYQHFEKKPK